MPCYKSYFDEQSFDRIDRSIHVLNIILFLCNLRADTLVVVPTASRLVIF